MKYDDLYLDYKDEELEVKMALESTGVDSKVAAEAARLYQMGKAQDLIYAEQALASGASFTTVNKIIAGNLKKRAEARPDFDDKLRKALIRAGKLPDLINKYQAHHIIAKGAKRAKFAIDILQALGIDVDDPANGVFLPATKEDKNKGAFNKAYVHNTVHTIPYYANVNYLIVRTFERNAHKSDNELKQAIVKKLGQIANELRAGKFPLYNFIPGADTYIV